MKCENTHANTTKRIVRTDNITMDSSELITPDIDTNIHLHALIPIKS